MKKLIRTFKQVFLLIVAVTFIGCEDDEAVMPKVVAGFTYTLNADTGTVTFLNISENATNYEWKFGDETTSALNNPVKTYASGTYIVTLKAKNVAGASDTFEDTIIILIPEIATLPITFDGENTKYEPIVFEGASFEVVDNPAPGGSNNVASKVGAITNSGVAFEGLFFELGAPIDLAVDKTIKMNFWANAPVDVLLKLEEGSSSTPDVIVSHGGSGWEELMFNFTASSTYSKLVIFVDGPGTSTGTFYVDDIMQIETPVATNGCSGTVVAATTFPVDFEGCESFVDSFANDGSITTELAANPDKAGVNTSDYVLKVVKATATNRWAGIQNAFPNNFDATQTLSMKVYSSKANVVMKIEVNSNPQEAGSGNPGPQYATITDANKWTDVQITFTGIPPTNTGLNQIVIKPDNPDGTDGSLTDSEGTYYFDDIAFGSTGGGNEPTVAAPTPTQASADVKSIFSDAYTDIAGTNLDTNWQGDLVSETVTIAGNDAIKYSNAKFIGMELAGDTDFSDMEFLHVDIWTPDATALSITPISPPNETLVPLTGLTQGEWKSFNIPLSDFTGVDFTKILQFKIDAQDGVNPAVIYMDNLYFYKVSGTGSGTDSIILDFENNLTGVTASAFESFGALITNPVSGTINTSPNVYEASFSNTNQWWGGVGFAFAANVLDDQATEYKVKLYSTVAPTNVLFQVEVDGTNAPVGDVQTITTANEWVEVTFNLANIPAGVNRILIRPDVGDQSTTKPNTGVLYIDDIVCVNCTLNSGGGGGGDTGTCPAPPTGELLSNGDFEAGESCWQLFAGTSISTTVSNGGSNSAEMQGAAGVAVNFKQERFAIGVVQPNTAYTVSFDIIADGPFGDGGVFKAFTFSEGVDGGSVPATLHTLTDSTTSLATTWETKTYTFTTAPNANQVEGGLSFLLEIVNSSAKLNVDNVVIKPAP